MDMMVRMVHVAPVMGVIRPTRYSPSALVRITTTARDIQLWVGGCACGVCVCVYSKYKNPRSAQCICTRMWLRG